MHFFISSRYLSSYGLSFGTALSNVWKMQNHYQEYVKLKTRVEVLQHSQRWYFHLYACLFFLFTIILQQFAFLFVKKVLVNVLQESSGWRSGSTYHQWTWTAWESSRQDLEANQIKKGKISTKTVRMNDVNCVCIK